MIINIDVGRSLARVAEPEVFTAFAVRSSTTDDSVVGAAMGHAGHSAGDSHVWVSAQWITDQVSGTVDAGWSEGYTAMLGYAASKGWMNEEGTHIKAHIEVDEAPTGA